MTLSRYRDVAAALREPLLIPVSPRSASPSVPIDRAVHADFRSQALRALAPAAIGEWEAQFTQLADRFAAAIPHSRPVDLVGEYARPWSLAVAGLAAGVPADRAERLSALARQVFESAAEPYDEALGAASQAATAELARFFQAAPPWHLQMFIALAHSLPAFLGNAWLALAAHPAELAELRRDGSLLPAAMEELLRFAGPAKAQFRQALAPVTIGECTIPRDGQVILRLDLANRDPEEFPEPDRLLWKRRAIGHLAFGAGAHACVGSMLIQSAARIATRALLAGFDFRPEFSATPVDAFAVRYLSSLVVQPGSQGAKL